jgi:hypothetical protein
MKKLRCKQCLETEVWLNLASKIFTLLLRKSNGHCNASRVGSITHICVQLLNNYNMTSICCLKSSGLLPGVIFGAWPMFRDHLFVPSSILFPKTLKKGQTSDPETLVMHQKWRRVITQTILSNITTTAEAFNYMTSIYQPPVQLGTASWGWTPTPAGKRVNEYAPLCLHDMLGETFTITRIYACHLNWYHEAWFILKQIKSL